MDSSTDLTQTNDFLQLIEMNEPQKEVHWEEEPLAGDGTMKPVDLIDIIVSNDESTTKKRNVSVSKNHSLESHDEQQKSSPKTSSNTNKSAYPLRDSRDSFKKSQDGAIRSPLRNPFARSITFEEFSAQFRAEMGDEPDASGTKRFVIAGRTIPGMYKRTSIEEIMDLDFHQLRKDKETYWIDIDCPSKADLDLIESKFGLHPLTTEDVREESREKIETFEHYLFVVAREMQHYTLVYNVNIMVFQNVVLTIHYNEVESVEQVYYRLKYGTVFSSEKIMQSGDWVLYTILDAIIDDFVGHVSAMSVEAEALDELVLVFNSDVQNDLLRRIGNARKLLTILRSHLWSKRELLLTLTNKEHPFINTGIKIYLRDVLDNTAKLEEKLSNAKEMLTNLHATYLARISLEVAEFSNKVNKVVKKFSAVATICIPLTLVAGLFGMNVKVPGGGADDLWWFFGICMSMLIVSVVSFSIFIRKGWF